MFDSQEQVAPKTDSSEASVAKYSNLKPFQKGISGNPGGRKKTDDIRVLARKHTKEAFERIVELIGSDDERVAIMAAKEVIDRAYGKAKPMEDEDETNKKNITINIVRYSDRDQPAKQLDAPTVSVRTLALP